MELNELVNNLTFDSNNTEILVNNTEYDDKVEIKIKGKYIEKISIKALIN